MQCREAEGLYGEFGGSCVAPELEKVLDHLAAAFG